MSFPRYERYSLSDIPWIKELPAGWKTQRLKTIFQLVARPVRDEDEIVTAFRDGEVTLRNKRRQEGFTNALQEIGYQGVRINDLVIHAMDAFAGAIGVSDSDGKSTPVYSVCRPRSTATSSEYYGSLLRYMALSGYINSLAKGIRERSTDFRWSDAGNVLVPVPSEQEQASIVGFIEIETARIDALIEEQRRLVELLKEKRQAVISYAVTRGLTPHVQMKDSGIEWVGEVPQSWNIKRLRMVADVKGGVAKGRDLGGAETISVPYLRVANVQDGYLDLTEISTIDITPAELERYRLRPGDVLMNEGGDFDKLGRGHIWRGEISDCIHQNHVFSVRPKDIEPEWLTLISTADCGRFYFMTRSKQSTNLASISSSNLGELPVPLPPQSERKEILAAVGSSTAAINALIQDAVCAIALLEERRNALISAAVTGKIDARAYVAKPVMHATRYNSGFAHQLLAAEILDRYNSQRMGRIKLQKLIHLCEYHGQISEVQGDYSRKAAGPFDAKAMAGISKNLKKQKWFEEVREGERYVYRPLEKHGEHKKYLSHWQTEMPRIDEVLSLLGNFRTRECEIISTLYAAWNDLLIDGGPTDDAAILHEASSAERWHKSKEQIAPERWTKALHWMKEKGLVPVGYGKHTRHTAGQIGPTTEEAHEPA